LKIKPSHCKFLFEKLKQMDNSEYCKFTLQLLKHLNKNMCKGPVTDQAAHDAGFGKTQRHGDFDMDGLINTKKIGFSDFDLKRQKKTRSFSLGGDEKENEPHKNERHNSPVATTRGIYSLSDVKINVSPFDIAHSRPQLNIDILDPEFEEVKEIASKLEEDRQSTDEEDKKRGRVSLIIYNT
jgi:hypothetical protein